MTRLFPKLRLCEKNVLVHHWVMFHELDLVRNVLWIFSNDVVVTSASVGHKTHENCLSFRHDNQGKTGRRAAL